VVFYELHGPAYDSNTLATNEFSIASDSKFGIAKSLQMLHKRTKYYQEKQGSTRSGRQANRCSIK
jgi:hypothetical protein